MWGLGRDLGGDVDGNQEWMLVQCSLFRGEEAAGVWHLLSQFTCGEEAETRIGIGMGMWWITVDPDVGTGGHWGNETELYNYVLGREVEEYVWV